MLRFLRGLSVVTLSLAIATGSAAASEPMRRHDMTDAERGAVEAKMKRMLRDPSSAQFEDVGAMIDGDTLFVCGRLNAKNLYGGYVGFQPFYGRMAVSAGRPVFDLTSIGDDKQKAHSVGMACARKGMLVY